MKTLARVVAWSTLLFSSATVLAQLPESAFERDPWPMSKEGPVKDVLGSARIYTRMGKAFARELLELIAK